ncbi:HipA domain-containing protein [Oerskovia sp. M15]
MGRNLIDRRRRASTTTSGTTARVASEVDYLVGVADQTRQGDLRFRSDSGPFLDPDHDVPPVIELPRLFAASDRVARDDDDLAAVKELLAAGTGSLGGARPRPRSATGTDSSSPSSPPWGHVGRLGLGGHRARTRAGSRVPVPRRHFTRLDGRGALLLERFDRKDDLRVGYASAMTLVQAHDGDVRDYLDVVDAITEHGARVRADLRELWKRVALSVALHNTDDHLRNTGFLRASGGWVLSPVFDVNPEPDPERGRVTGIGGVVTPPDEIEALLNVASYFDLDERGATGILREVLAATEDWRAVADRHGVAPTEVDRFAPSLDSAQGTIRRVLR